MTNERYSEFIEEVPKTWVQGLYEESTTKKQTLGVIRPLADGREFVYCKLSNDANAVVGQVYQSPIGDVANIANLAITANANVGDREILFTLGNSNLANELNAFEDGYAYINTGNGAGQTFKIKKHAAIAANANGTIYLYDKIRVALKSADSKLSLYKSPHRDIIVHPSPPTTTPLGVATFVVTANRYAWFQKRGPHAAEVEGTVVNGDIVICSESVDGTVGPGANGASEEEYPVGVCMANNANDHWALIDFKL